jgi:hypothetical protein
MIPSDRQEILQNQTAGASSDRKGPSTFAELALGRPVWIEPERLEIPLFCSAFRGKPASAFAKGALARFPFERNRSNNKKSRKIKMM